MAKKPKLKHRPTAEWPAEKARLFHLVEGALERKKYRSLAALCEAAGASRGYLSALFATPKQEARREYIDGLAKALEVAPEFIREGYEFDATTLRLAALIASASPEDKDDLVRYVERYLSAPTSKSNLGD